MTTAMLYTKQDSDKIFFKLFHYISGNNSDREWTLHIVFLEPFCTSVLPKIYLNRTPSVEVNLFKARSRSLQSKAVYKEITAHW